MNTKHVKKESEPKLPKALSIALKSHPKAQIAWGDITPIARRDFITWIEGAKQEETRTKRIAKAIDMLIVGKRRPCCYAVVPMNLYKTLDTLPKAKVTWKSLTPTERRDFVAWIDGAKDKEEGMHRIEKACVMLLDGKRCIFQKR